jgi:hypothetical protein
MQGKQCTHTSTAAAPTAKQQQHNHSRHWQKLLSHHTSPAKVHAAAAHSKVTIPAGNGAVAGNSSDDRPAWLSFLQGMLDAHHKHHLPYGISISRDNSSIKYSKSSSSSKHSHKKGQHSRAAATATAAAAAVAMPQAADNSSAADTDAVSVPCAATPHVPVCWPYV